MLMMFLGNLDNDDERNKMEQLYCLYTEKLVYYAQSIIKDEHDAESIVQTAFEKSIRFLGKIGEPESEETFGFFITVVKNLCFDYLRKRKRVETVDFSVMEYEIADTTATNPEISYIENESYREILKIIDELPEQFKTILLLRFVHNLSVKDIANIMELSINAVSVRLLRAKKRLMKEMKHIMKEEWTDYEGEE